MCKVSSSWARTKRVPRAPSSPSNSSDGFRIVFRRFFSSANLSSSSLMRAIAPRAAMITLAMPAAYQDCDNKQQPVVALPMSQRSVTKRPLSQQKEALSDEEFRRAAEEAVFYDVVDASNSHFGLCVVAPSGAQVYVEPLAMVGTEVRHPMRVSNTANALRLAVAMGTELTAELSR